MCIVHQVAHASCPIYPRHVQLVLLCHSMLLMTELEQTPMNKRQPYDGEPGPAVVCKLVR